MAAASGDKPGEFPDAPGVVDREAFEQILEMDEDDERDFSRGIVFGFLEQAQSTFESMEEALKEKNLDKLSQLGHFLKGSSATLGFIKVRDECEKIQHYGTMKDETGTSNEPDEKKCLRLIDAALQIAQRGYSEVEEWVKKFYDSVPDSN